MKLLYIPLLLLYPYLILCSSGSRSRRRPEHDDLPFFRQIQQLNLDWDDIVGLYRNVSAEVETEQCRSKCKTAIAFWVLQSLKPCDLIQKMDCPKGLLCCVYDTESDIGDGTPIQASKDKGTSVSDRRPTPDPAIESEESQVWTEPENLDAILDPIPEEEPQPFVITELNKS